MMINRSKRFARKAIKVDHAQNMIRLKCLLSAVNVMYRTARTYSCSYTKDR